MKPILPPAQLSARRPLLLVSVVIVVFLFKCWAAFADWARLADGEIVEIVSESQQSLTVRTADGATRKISRTDVRGRLSKSDASRRVDQVLEKSGDRAQHAEVRRQLSQLGMAAVPALVGHLRSTSKTERLSALAGLQFAWSTKAVAPVTKLLEDSDTDVRRLAQSVLHLQLKGDQRLAAMRLLQTNRNPEIAGPALAEVLSIEPDFERMRSAVTNPKLSEYLAPLLPRYQGRQFSKASRKLLVSEIASEKSKRSALVALAYQGDTSKDAAKLVAAFATDKEASIREAAAGYFLWCGNGGDVPLLTKWLRQERDPYVKVTLRAAVESIKWRASHFPAAETDPQQPSPPWLAIEDTTQSLDSALKHLQERPDIESARIVRKALNDRVPVDPFFQFKGPSSMTEWQGGSWNQKNATQAAQLLTSLIRNIEHPAKRELPSNSTKLFPPVRNYFDAKRVSYGIEVDGSSGPFAGSVHVGDDVAWWTPGATVVAIADGIVLDARPAYATWGGLITIEHRAPDGSPFCSLYGHLGPVLLVRAGESVEAGQMIGQLGRDFSRDNGGYGSHLHFGIYRGPARENWITGYISPRRFADKANLKWADPQEFLKSGTR